MVTISREIGDFLNSEMYFNQTRADRNAKRKTPCVFNVSRCFGASTQQAMLWLEH